MKLRSQRAIETEYKRVSAELRRADGSRRDQLYGAMQALAWALNDEAMAPLKAFQKEPPAP